VLSAGDDQATPLAAAHLGGLLVSLGDIQRARLLLESALSSGDMRVAPMAKASLGTLALGEGDLDGARRLLEPAFAAGRPACQRGGGGGGAGGVPAGRSIPATPSGCRSRRPTSLC
jgi:hypothetical protein